MYYEKWCDGILITSIQCFFNKEIMVNSRDISQLIVILNQIGITYIETIFTSCEIYYMKVIKNLTNFCFLSE